MRKKMLFAVLACIGVAALRQAALAQAPKQNPAPPPPLQTQTRLITVDVVVTDSHGKPIRGLTQGDFQLSEEHAGQQKIAKFRYVDTTTSTPAPASPPLPPGVHVYSNQAFSKLAAPPTILLLDALNTDLGQQAEVHRHMVNVLKTLPDATPVAVFLLGNSLRVLQGFTTDPKLLRAAVDKAISGTDIAQSPQDDPDSPSNIALATVGAGDAPDLQALQEFEATTYEAQTSIRVDETTAAMVAIAKYLRGYPGRKNLVWFSMAFPNWIEPNTDFGTDAFNGSASYENKILEAFESLTDAQVAVYPVDARGLEPSQATTADKNGTNSTLRAGGGLTSQLSREDDSRFAAQSTMEEIATQTGGKACANTNDLSGCVQNALDDSSAYYELGYYPENVKWDNRFHKITVKSNQHGTRLRYRTGYFATDAVTLAAQQNPTKLLQQACAGPLPSTSIPLTVMPIRSQPSQGTQQTPQSRYLLTVSADGVSLPSVGEARELHLQMAVCEYNGKSDSFLFYPRDLSESVPDALYKDWQANGMRDVLDFEAKPDSQRLRFAVLDMPTGATGSIDVPAHPPEFVAAAPVAPPPAGPPPAVRFSFKGSNGGSSVLDWSTGTLTYHGEISLDQGAIALFKGAYGNRFHCEAGKLIANDPASNAVASLLLSFRLPDGRASQVALTGDSPSYSGDLTIDPSARSFFEIFWKLAHCQQP